MKIPLEVWHSYIISLALPTPLTDMEGWPDVTQQDSGRAEFQMTPDSSSQPRGQQDPTLPSPLSTSLLCPGVHTPPVLSPRATQLSYSSALGFNGTSSEKPPGDTATQGTPFLLFSLSLPAGSLLSTVTKW